jgi:hypothetical protein
VGEEGDYETLLCKCGLCTKCVLMDGVAVKIEEREIQGEEDATDDKEKWVFEKEDYSTLPCKCVLCTARILMDGGTVQTEEEQEVQEDDDAADDEHHVKFQLTKPVLDATVSSEDEKLQPLQKSHATSTQKNTMQLVKRYPKFIVFSNFSFKRMLVRRGVPLPPSLPRTPTRTCCFCRSLPRPARLNSHQTAPRNQTPTR